MRSVVDRGGQGSPSGSAGSWHPEDRLFFRPFEAEVRRLLLILWLGFPRKDGDRNDCYALFSRWVQRGELPEDWENLQRDLLTEHGEHLFVRAERSPAGP
jgi:hypothetical protein